MEQLRIPTQLKNIYGNSDRQDPEAFLSIKGLVIG